LARKKIMEIIYDSRNGWKKEIECKCGSILMVYADDVMCYIPSSVYGDLYCYIKCPICNSEIISNSLPVDVRNNSYQKAYNKKDKNKQ
jgi:predicted DNA-binding protein (UPF0278 family)